MLSCIDQASKIQQTNEQSMAICKTKSIISHEQPVLPFVATLTFVGNT